MNEEYRRLKKCRNTVKKLTDFKPEVALVLGSGLSNLANCADVKAIVEYKDIKDFPVTTVSGHKGRFVFGYIKKVPVVLMQGRVHYYEGYAMNDVVLPIRLMGLLGAKSLVLTNAAGAINKNLRAGDLMVITDQISSFVPSPLIGENIPELGVRFPDMSEIYSKYLIDVIERTGESLSIKLKKGVYVQASGPNYESPAEIKMFSSIGADAVGMSTACEAIAAKHMGMDVCAVSCISNMAAGSKKIPLTHSEVKHIANITAPKFTKLIEEAIPEIYMAAQQ
ncbi:MAG: purine-nucleoside phosphorylase [Acutalibacteraceae bacterium]